MCAYQREPYHSLHVTSFTILIKISKTILRPIVTTYLKLNIYLVSRGETMSFKFDCLVVSCETHLAHLKFVDDLKC